MVSHCLFGIYWIEGQELTLQPHPWLVARRVALHGVSGGCAVLPFVNLLM